MEYQIKGDVLQILEVRLKTGESVYTERGGMAWMTDGVEMSTSGRGGIGKMLGRALSGESMFLTSYKATADGAMVVFAPETMGKVIALNLPEGQSMIAQKDAFMCAADSVTLEMHFRKKLGAGFFGGEGFILQKLTGPGMAFVEIDGEVAEYTLKQGQRVKVDPGHIAMYEPSVQYDITTVKGLKNIFFSGEGLFLATLTGPGKIWLQTMPVSNMAHKIASAVPGKSAAGGIIKGIIDIST